MENEEGDDMVAGCGSEAVCVGVEEFGETGEDAVDSGVGGWCGGEESLVKGFRFGFWKGGEEDAAERWERTEGWH
jgi:hypothetical protein